MTADEPPDLLNGGCSAWALPADESCSKVGRGLIRTALGWLATPDERVHDIATAVSELAANGLDHGDGRSGHLELWAYRRLTPESQLVVKVFDPKPCWEQPAREAESTAEHGRGMQIVEALTGRWGWHLSRSRLAAMPVSGKATWFCLPLPEVHEQPVHPHLPVRQAARELHWQLACRGIGRTRCAHGIDRSLVSIPGLTIWSEPPATLRWLDRERGAYQCRPVADLVDVVEIAVRLHEEVARTT